MLLHYGRWAKLKREFYKPKKAFFDTTKIPDLYDNAMYDMLHLKAFPALYTPTLQSRRRALAQCFRHLRHHLRLPQGVGAEAQLLLPVTGTTCCTTSTCT